MWGRDWSLLSPKHPNLIGWVLEASRLVTGETTVTPLILAQAMIALSLWICHRFAREFLPPDEALVSVLLLLGVYHFGWHTTQINPNIVSIPIWAAGIYAFWKCRETGSLVWWLTAAVCAALALYAKLSGAILLTCGCAYILVDPKLRAQLATRTPWLALLAFSALVIPLADALWSSNFSILKYAASKAEGRGGNALYYLLFQVGMMGGLLVVTALSVEHARPTETTRDGLWTLLLIMGLGPFVVTILPASVTTANLKGLWGTAMFSLAGLAAVAILKQAGWRLNAARAATVMGVLIVGSGAAYAITKGFATWRNNPSATAMPQREISRRLERQWSQEVKGAPLKFVAGDDWAAGLVALSANHTPRVLPSDAFPTAEAELARIERDGLLVVWFEGPVPAFLLKRYGALQTCTPTDHSFALTRPASAVPVTMQSCVVQPAVPDTAWQLR